MNIKNIINKLPKVELHVHIEGTMEPEQLLLFAKRNGIAIHASSDEIRASRKAVRDINDFFAIYKQACAVLQTEQDYYDLMFAYLQRAHADGVIHAEIFFDLQSYGGAANTNTVIHGYRNAMDAAHKQLGITSFLILCVLRDLSEESAFQALEQSLPHRDIIRAIGLASDAVGNPPEKFKRVFEAARCYGYHAVAHAGEQDGPDAIWQALKVLKAERIDHGVRCIEDANLVDYLAEQHIPLTICPLSNEVLGIFPDIKDNPILKLFNQGVRTTINSDDPAFFDGYIADNYQAVYDAFDISLDMLIMCAQYSIESSFLDRSTKEDHTAALKEFINTYSSS